MADIELVIKIDEEEYNIVKNCTAPMTWAEHLIKNGTPLLKGHGRLIDTSQEVEVQLYDDEHEEFTEQMMTIEEFLNRYTNGAITIIEAMEEMDKKYEE